MRRLAACILATFLLGAHAASASVPIVADSRIKTLVYNENEVYTITTHYGYQANVEFGRNESIEAVSVGDRVGWQIVPAGRRLFIRAMEENSHTNMTIVTNKRAYQFDLRSSSSNAVYGSEELTYVLRFYYPDASGTPSVTMGGAPMDGGIAPNYQSAPSAPQAAPRGMPAPLPELPGSRYGSAPFGQGSSLNHFPASAPSAASSAAPFASGPVVVAGVVEPPAPVVSTPISPLQPIGTPGAQVAAPAAIPTPPAPAPAPIAAAAPVVAAPAPAPAPAPVAVAAAPAPVPAAPAPLPVNYRYTYSGPDAAAPLKIFDDGRATYFKFRGPLQGAKFVAIDAQGAEREVPYTINSEGLAVIDVVAPRVKLNQTSGQVVVYNEAMG